MTPASRLLIAFAMLLTLASPVSAKQATPATTDALARSTAWLLSQQLEDGGFPGFSGTSDPGATTDAIFALVAAREAGIDVDLDAAVAYLESGDVALVYAQTGAGQAAKLALAVVATSGDPHDVNGVDPLILAVMGLNAETGLYGTGVFDHAYVMLAMAAASEEVPTAAIDRLSAVQIDDGSWAFDGSTAAGAGDTNTTAMAIMALVAADAGDSDDVTEALAYLRATQVEDGGFPYQPADVAVADANSTGIAIQALIAAGEDPSAAEWNEAASALLTFQNPSGAFSYQGDSADDNLFATVQAIPAVAGLSLPILPRESNPVASPVAA